MGQGPRGGGGGRAGVALGHLERAGPARAVTSVTCSTFPPPGGGGGCPRGFCPRGEKGVPGFFFSFFPRGLLFPEETFLVKGELGMCLLEWRGGGGKGRKRGAGGPPGGGCEYVLKVRPVELRLVLHFHSFTPRGHP